MALHWKKSDSQALSRKFVFDLRFKFEFLDYLLYINKVQQKSNLEKYASRRTFAKRAAWTFETAVEWTEEFIWLHLRI